MADKRNVDINCEYTDEGIFECQVKKDGKVVETFSGKNLDQLRAIKFREFM